MEEHNSKVLKYADALVKTHYSLQNELELWKFRVHSTMFVASATILTLVCSLGEPIRDNRLCLGTEYNHLDYIWWLNTVTVLLNGICLLALLICLYQNIHATKEVRGIVEKRFDTLKKTLLIPSDEAVCVDGEYKIISRHEKHWIFSICEKIACFSFSLVVIGLILRYLS